jgi:hypothetical protein
MHFHVCIHYLCLPADLDVTMTGNAKTRIMNTSDIPSLQNFLPLSGPSSRPFPSIRVGLDDTNTAKNPTEYQNMNRTDTKGRLTCRLV